MSEAKHERVSVLLVDDSTAVRTRLAEILAEHDAVGEIRQASNVAEARLHLQGFAPDTVVLDIEMPGCSGLEMIAELRARQPRPRVIVLTNYPTPEYRNRCLALGADQFLDKTLEFHRVPEIIGGAVQETAPVSDSSANVRQEVDRLLDLFDYHIVGTPAEQCYDDLTAMAARLCDTPVALLTLNDADRQWIKSFNGTPAFGVPDIREHCLRAAASVGPYVVTLPATSASREVAGSQPASRFFAGVPLTTHDGFSLGTLAVLDHRARELDVEQLGHLEALARQVVSLLELRRMALAMRNVNERRSAAERVLEARSSSDALTGLWNRAAFRQALSEKLTLTRSEGTRVACMYLDLDDFKQVNDRLGHAAGDALLRMVADRLRDTLRDSDLIARLGGDEFAIALAGVGDTEQIGLLARRLLERLCSPYPLGGDTVAVRASIGISVAPEDGVDLDELLQRADLALAHVKELGKSEFRFFSRDMRERRLARRELELTLRGALDSGGFRLLYQPRIACDNGMLVGCEALLRWPGAPRHTQDVRTIIEEVEKFGLGEELGYWVVDAACAQLARWRAAGVNMPLLAINITASQMRPGFAARLCAIAAVHDVPLDCLELEISEEHVLEDLQRSTVAIGEIRELGVRVALDDFGTGYAALSLLRSIRFDAVKIDPEIVRSAGTRDRDGTMVSGLVALAHSLGLRVTAEGVETSAQLLALRGDDCDDFQGFLVSPPLEPAALEREARERRVPLAPALTLDIAR